METLSSEDSDPVWTSLRMVDEADIYIGIYAHRYPATYRVAGGCRSRRWIPPGRGGRHPRPDLLHAPRAPTEIQRREQGPGRSTWRPSRNGSGGSIRWRTSGTRTSSAGWSSRASPTSGAGLDRVPPVRRDPFATRAVHRPPLHAVEDGVPRRPQAGVAEARGLDGEPRLGRLPGPSLHSCCDRRHGQEPA